MAAVEVINLIQGPATLYLGDFGAAEPADTDINSTPAASAWTDLGATDGGVRLIVNQEFSMLQVDQVTDPVGRRQTSRDVRVATNLAEATLSNLAVALNGGTSASGSGFTKYTPDDGLASGVDPDYKALILDGYAPAGQRRRVILRKVLSVENVEAAYAKDGKFMYPVTWSCHWIDASTTPYVVVDAEAA